VSLATLTTSYAFAPRDSEENFPDPLLYIGWENHLLFCAPVCVPVAGNTLFVSLQDKILKEVYGAHPDVLSISWNDVLWFKSSRPWYPNKDKSLIENGIKHKDVIRFRTPNLFGIAGSNS
jgi:phenol hydroxylase P4 protein